MLEVLWDDNFQHDVFIKNNFFLNKHVLLPPFDWVALQKFQWSSLITMKSNDFFSKDASAIRDNENNHIFEID